MFAYNKKKDLITFPKKIFLFQLPFKKAPKQAETL